MCIPYAQNIKKIAANAAATRWTHHGCQTGVCICLCIKRPWEMIDFEPKSHIPQPVVHTHLLSSCCMPDAQKMHLRPGGHAPELFLTTPLTSVELWANHFLPVVVLICSLKTRKFSAARRSYCGRFSMELLQARCH
jgi:hypothetical protein